MKQELTQNREAAATRDQENEHLKAALQRFEEQLQQTQQQEKSRQLAEADKLKSQLERENEAKLEALREELRRSHQEHVARLKEEHLQDMGRLMSESGKRAKMPCRRLCCATDSHVYRVQTKPWLIYLLTDLFVWLVVWLIVA